MSINSTCALLLLLLLLSHFSHVRFCATPETASYQAPPFLGFFRQEQWSGLPFPSPMHESESEVAESSPTLSDPMDCGPPGSSVHGIFQARVLTQRKNKPMSTRRLVQDVQSSLIHSNHNWKQPKCSLTGYNEQTIVCQ